MDKLSLKLAYSPIYPLLDYTDYHDAEGKSLQFTRDAIGFINKFMYLSSKLYPSN